MAQQQPLECIVELRGDVYVTVDPCGSCHPTTGWELYLWQAARTAPAEPAERVLLSRWKNPKSEKWEQARQWEVDGDRLSGREYAWATIERIEP